MMLSQATTDALDHLDQNLTARLRNQVDNRMPGMERDIDIINLAQDIAALERIRDRYGNYTPR